MIQSVLILDGNAIAYRAFYAVRGLATRTGQPTNALFGFIRMLRQLESHWQPDRLVVTFDGGSPAHRLEKCPAYKAQRAPMPDELRSQLGLINDFLAASGIPRILIPDQEADDVIATLAARAAAEGATVRVATSDKDLMQLVDDRVRLVPPTKANEELDAAGVAAKTGVSPAQIVDWLALIGDAADNIPGVNGIGPKTATKLIAQFGSLAACFEHAEQIESDSVRAKLQAGRSIAELNVELMRLDRNVPGVPDWPDIPAPAPDANQLNDFFVKYELHRFAGEVPEKPAEPAPPAQNQMSLF
jgi:DNA polymerase-1